MTCLLRDALGHMRMHTAKTIGCSVTVYKLIIHLKMSHRYHYFDSCKLDD